PGIQIEKAGFSIGGRGLRSQRKDRAKRGIGVHRMLGVEGMGGKHRCDFAGCFHEVKMSRAEWLILRQYAYELDLNSGSYYDVRIQAVSVWCGPQNKPIGWPDLQIYKGTRSFLRDYVGVLIAEGMGRRKITLHFCIRAYTRCKATGAEWMSDAYQRILRGTDEDQKWVMRQFDLLRDHVTLMRNGSSLYANSVTRKSCKKPFWCRSVLAMLGTIYRWRCADWPCYSRSC